MGQFQSIILPIMTLLFLFLPSLILAQGLPGSLKPVTLCPDQGCEGSVEGRGTECVDVRGADWRYLDSWYQLNMTMSSGLCKQDGPDHCCKCLAKHPPEEDPCTDRGCKDQWGGQGTCVSVFSREFPKVVNILLDLSVGGMHGLCGDGCCTCFKTKFQKKEYDYVYRPFPGGGPWKWKPSTLSTFMTMRPPITRMPRFVPRPLA